MNKILIFGIFQSFCHFAKVSLSKNQQRPDYSKPTHILIFIFLSSTDMVRIRNIACFLSSSQNPFHFINFCPSTFSWRFYTDLLILQPKQNWGNQCFLCCTSFGIGPRHIQSDVLKCSPSVLELAGKCVSIKFTALIAELYSTIVMRSASGALLSVLN